MENLILSPTEETPKIHFNCRKNYLIISGKSYPENTLEFYQPVYDWLKDYLKSCERQRITVDMDLVYFNSGTSRVLMNICDLLDEAATFGNKVHLNWIHESDDDDSIDFADMLREEFSLLRLNMIPKDL